MLWRVVVPNPISTWILGLPLALALFATTSCSSTPPPSLAEGCSINSDCEGTLICAFGRCHQECMTSKDCTGGATCLPQGVCQLPEETPCSETLVCVAGLVCADDKCRAACSPGVSHGAPGGCPEAQTCAQVSSQNVCIDNPSDGSTPEAGPSGLCTLDSDCEENLVCAFGRCHSECATSKDCMGGAICLPPGVCELPLEATCSTTLPCVTELTCAGKVCRAPCNPGASVGTPGGCLEAQVCTATPNSTTYVCVDSTVSGDAGALDSSAASPDAHGDGTISDASGDRATDVTLSDANHEASSGDASDASDAPACVVPDGSPEAGPLGFTPSNFDPLHLTSPDGGGAISIDAGPDGGGIDWSAAPDVVIKSGCLSDDGALATCLGVSPVTITLPQGSTNPPACFPNCLADLYVLNSLQIESGGSITVYSSPGSATQSKPIILAVRTFAQIGGPFLVGADGPGPGAFPVNTTILGPGAGGNGTTFGNSSGGAAFCGAGGGGAAGSGTPSPPGQPYGLPSIIPLQAGSAGGDAFNNVGFGGGFGGGGLQISAGTRIVVTNEGIIDANGTGYYGGGGSGGAILLEAPTIVIDGVLVANGGSGGYNATGPSGTGPSVGANGNLNDTPALGAAGGNGSSANIVQGSVGMIGDSGSAGTGWVGSGGGGAGWIRINTGASCSLTATLDSGFTFISPSLDSGCASTGMIQY